MAFKASQDAGEFPGAAPSSPPTPFTQALSPHSPSTSPFHSASLTPPAKNQSVASYLLPLSFTRGSYQCRAQVGASGQGAAGGTGEPRGEGRPSPKSPRQRRAGTQAIRDLGQATVF